MMDNIDLDGATMDELILQNAESMKQFEYLEKSLVTFQQAVSAQASELRQPIGECEKERLKHQARKSSTVRAYRLLK
jgi:hypothetical protein